jgi:hypothetical protein
MTRGPKGWLVHPHSISKETHMKSRRLLGTVAVGLATLLCTVAAQPASAHTPSASKTVYDGGGLCVIGKAQIAVNHATGELTSSAWTNARVAGGSSCDTIDVFAPSFLAVRYDLQRWNGSAWTNCRSTNWVQNTAWTWEVTVSNSYGTTPPCGAGYYRTAARSLVWDGSAWRGGDVDSGYHPLPVT